MNMSPENKAHFQAEKEAIHLILTGIGDEIYSTVDACQTAQELWEAIERLQQGESLDIQDVKTNLFWEFGKFTSHDGETMGSYYTRFYKLMNEMIRNNLTVATMQFGNQKTVNVVGARENVGSPVVQQSGIQCFNCKEFRHFAKECRKPKRVKDSAYEMDEEVQNNAGYNVFANDLQHFEQSESISNTYLVETDDSNVIPDSLDMCDDVCQNDQNDVESDDERVALANLIANLKLDVDENKKIQKRESISVQDSCLVALQTKQTEFETYKSFNDRTVDYDKLERRLNETL
nr:hypothetical protein [Tanacetum cinerariifolium]